MKPGRVPTESEAEAGHIAQRTFLAELSDIPKRELARRVRQQLGAFRKKNEECLRYVRGSSSEIWKCSEFEEIPQQSEGLRPSSSWRAGASNPVNEIESSEGRRGSCEERGDVMQTSSLLPFESPSLASIMPSYEAEWNLARPEAAQAKTPHAPGLQLERDQLGLANLNASENNQLRQGLKPRPVLNFADVASFAGPRDESLSRVKRLASHGFGSLKGRLSFDLVLLSQLVNLLEGGNNQSCSQQASKQDLLVRLDQLFLVEAESGFIRLMLAINKASPSQARALVVLADISNDASIQALVLQKLQSPAFANFLDSSTCALLLRVAIKLVRCRRLHLLQLNFLRRLNSLIT